MRSIRETASHILAFAILEVFPNAKIDSTHVSEEGYSCDVWLDPPIPHDMLHLVEAEMHRLSKEDPIMVHCEMVKENAATLFNFLNQSYLAEYALGHHSKIIPLVRSGEQHNICSESFLEVTPQHGFYKLIKIIQIDGRQRIYGIAAQNPSDLKKMLKRDELAQQRDHRRIGKELDLFTPQKNSYIWLPKGAFVKKTFIDWMTQEYQDQGFKLVETPDNNPSLAYQIGLHSYKELPIKYTEFHRDPQTQQTTETSQIFCSTSQVVQEVISYLQFIKKTVNIFDLECQYFFIPQIQKKSKAEEWLKSALDQLSSGHEEERAPDGPAIVVKIIDSIGRPSATGRVAIRGPLNKKGHPLRYQGADDEMHEPVIINCSLLGTVDRFIALLLEHFDGALPLWLTYEQVRVIPVKEPHNDYAAQVVATLKAAGLRAQLDARNDILSARIHAAEKMKVPYTVVVGDLEQKDNSIAIRSHEGAEVQKGVSVETFIERLKAEVKAKQLRKSPGEGTRIENK